MKIQTARFGTVTVDEKEILTFPEGLLGFASRKRFFIYNGDRNIPFFWLQSVDDPKLAFVICDPQMFFPEYKVPVRKEELSVLAAKDQSMLITCVIISITREPFSMSANLQGPLVINTENFLGKQVVLVDGSYGTRHPLVMKNRPRAVAVNAARGLTPVFRPAEMAVGNALVVS